MGFLKKPKRPVATAQEVAIQVEVVQRPVWVVAGVVLLQCQRLDLLREQASCKALTSRALGVGCEVT